MTWRVLLVAAVLAAMVIGAWALGRHYVLQ
jgi:hypothetical protein